MSVSYQVVPSVSPGQLAKLNAASCSHELRTANSLHLRTYERTHFTYVRTYEGAYLPSSRQ